jgi:hypothetical protein
MPAAYRVRNSFLYVSAKVTIRELDGTEYQLKKRIAVMILAAGYSRQIQRGLHQMIGLSVYSALRIVVRDSDPWKLNPESPPECTLAVYPARDQRTKPAKFGQYQDWLKFGVA